MAVTDTRRPTRQARYSIVVAAGLWFVSAACGSGEVTDFDASPSELPDAEAWATDHPQPRSGIPFWLVVGFSVGPGFAGDTIDVSIDGVSIVSGAWRQEEEEEEEEEEDSHGCTDPYALVLESGSHRTKVTTDSGTEFTTSFDLAEESVGIIQYRDPTGWSELTQPDISWSFYEGPYVCL